MTKDNKGQGVSVFSRSCDLMEQDPLEEIFALNLGDFLTEHLINPELAQKIGHSAHDKSESLKNQLKELVSIYSIDNTLCVMGFESEEDYIIYNSIAKTIKQMIGVEYCNIYLSSKSNPELHCAGSSFKENEKTVKDYVRNVYENKKISTIEKDGFQIIAIPMKNSFECIGALEVSRKIDKPLEEQYLELISITAGLFVTSLGLQKLIDEVTRLVSSDVVTISELQNLRAQLTAIIGDLGDQQQAFVEKMAMAVDLKGRHRYNHSKDVADLSRQICANLNLNEKTTDLIYYAGLLQNIGKIRLPEELFNKKEKLSAEDWQKLQDHPNAGVSLLMNINFLSEVIPYIHYQRERFDGGGRPEGLKGHSIPFGSRIIAAADAFCALVSERPHRPALSVKEALVVMKEEAALKWDPIVVESIFEIKS